MQDTISWNGISLGAEAVAVALLIGGFIVARLASYLVGRMLSAMDRRVARMATSETSVFRPRVIGIARASMFWLVFLLAIAMALRTLGFGPFSSLSGAAVAFIPQALVSFAIIAAGHLVGLLASNLVTRLNTDLPVDSIVPNLVYYAVLSVAIVMGLEHIAVDISFVTRLLLVAVAIVGGGIMLAFALGSRRYVENLLAHRELERLTPGERIRIDGEDGTVVGVHTTGVDIATREGTVTIPAARFAELKLLRPHVDVKGD